MRRFIIILQFLHILALPSNGQHRATGVYLTVKCNTEMKEYPALVDGKIVCLTDQPVVPSTEFLWISDLYEFPERGYIFFELNLSDRAFNTLKSIEHSIKDIQFAFVVDETLLFVTSEINHRSHRLISDGKSREFYTVYEKLKKQISPP